MIRRWRLWLFLAALILHGCMLFSLHYGFLDPLFHDSAPNMKGRGADFFTFYSSGRYYLEGKDLYTYPEHTIVPYAYLYFSYLPVFGMAFGSAANLFSPHKAYLVWVAATEFLLLINLFITYRLCRKFAPRAFLPAAAMWLGFTPYYVEIFMGQANFFMASAVFFMCVAFTGQKKFRAGFWWIVSLFVKMATLILIPLLWIHGQKKTVLIGISLILLTTALYFITMPGKTTTISFKSAPDRDLVPWKIEARQKKFPKITEQVLDRTVYIPISDRLPDISVPRGLFLLIGRQFLKPGTLSFASNPGVSSFVFNLAGSMTWVHVVKIVVLLFSLGLTIGKRPSFNQGVVLWIFTFFIAYTFTWEHHFVILLPALALFYILSNAFRPAVLVLFIPIALPSLYVFYRSPVITSVLYYATKSVPILGLYFLVVLAIIKKESWEKG